MIKLMRAKILLTCLLALMGTVFLGVEILAQAVDSSDISIDVIPPNPAPGEDVTINLSSYVNNLDATQISWIVGGKSVLSGTGRKSLSLVAPALGGETTVTVRLNLQGGVVEEKIVVRSSMMVLLWQAQSSYVPPFYKGKAMLPRDSGVKVVAMPEVRKSGGGVVDPNTMIYSWQKDYSNDGEGSGYGKNFFVYSSDFLDPTNNVSVTATTVSGDRSAQGSLDIPTSEPKIVFYKNDAALGTRFEEALRDGHKINGEETVVAAPYFIYPKELGNPRLTFDWFINDEPVPIFGIFKNLIPLKVQEGVTGTSILRLEVNNIDKVFESATKEINVEF
jgi:hypothetical protein